MIIMDKMTIGLNVFCPFMEDIIVSNMNGTLVVTIKRSSRGCNTTKSLRSYRNQRNSDVISAMTQYYASVLEQATRICFFLLQEIREEPRRKQ